MYICKHTCTYVSVMCITRFTGTSVQSHPVTLHIQTIMHHTHNYVHSLHVKHWIHCLVYIPDVLVTGSLGSSVFHIAQLYIHTFALKGC